MTRSINANSFEVQPIDNSSADDASPINHTILLRQAQAEVGADIAKAFMGAVGLVVRLISDAGRSVATAVGSPRAA